MAKQNQNEFYSTEIEKEKIILTKDKIESINSHLARNLYLIYFLLTEDK